MRWDEKWSLWNPFYIWTRTRTYIHTRVYHERKENVQSFHSLSHHFKKNILHFIIYILTVTFNVAESLQLNCMNVLCMFCWCTCVEFSWNLDKFLRSSSNTMIIYLEHCTFLIVSYYWLPLRLSWKKTRSTWLCSSKHILNQFFASFGRIKTESLWEKKTKNVTKK